MALCPSRPAALGGGAFWVFGLAIRPAGFVSLGSEHSDRRRRSGEVFPEIRDQGTSFVYQGRNRKHVRSGPTGPVGGRERSVARKLCYEFAQPIAGVREDRDSVADDERVEVECEDAPQTRA
jgi:hypothetical protein